MSLILHITRPDDWAAAQATGVYRADSLASEGFIHCSTADQVVPVANAFFHGQTDLALLCIETERLTAELRFEPPIHPGSSQPDTAANALFPHLYGPLNTDAVIAVVPFPPGAEGAFALPPGVWALLLAAPDVITRVRAENTLLAARALAALLDALHDPVLEARWRAVVALGWLGDARAVEPLLAALPTAGYEVKVNIVWALGQIADPRVIEPLAKLVMAEGEHEPDIRCVAALTLGRLGAVSVLEAALASGHEPVYGFAHAALAARRAGALTG